MALGAMDPSSAAKAFNVEYLDANFVGACLRETRPEMVYPIIKRIAPERLAKVILSMTSGETGSMLVGMPLKDVGDFLDSLGFTMTDNSTIRISIMDSVRHYVEAKKLFACQLWQPQKAIAALLKLHPKIAARVLAGVSAPRAAMALCGSASAGFMKASAQLTEMANIASTAYALGIPFKHHNIKRATLLQGVASVKNDADLLEVGCMLEKCKELMELFTNVYGVACTLTRADPSLFKRANVWDKTLEDATKIVDGNHREGWTRLREIAIDVVATTEAIQWSRDPEAAVEAGGLGVRMDPKKMSEYQIEALSKDEVVYKNTIMVVPVLLPDGTKWGTISHVMTGHAFSHVLNDLRPPAVNVMPVALECLDLMAAALRLCVGTVLQTRREAAAHSMAMAAMLRERKNTMKAHERTEAIKKMLSGLDEIRCNAELSIRNAGMTKMLEEIKTYKKPPLPVIKTMAVLMVVLNKDGFKEHLGDNFNQLPSDNEAAMATLWKHTVNQIDLNPSSDDYFMQSLQDTCTTQGLINLSKTDEGKTRVAAAESLMRDINQETLSHSSNAAGSLYDLIHLAVQACDEMRTYAAP
eukprot:gene1127-1684_t